MINEALGSVQDTQESGSVRFMQDLQDGSQVMHDPVVLSMIVLLGHTQVPLTVGVNPRLHVMHCEGLTGSQAKQPMAHF